MQLMKTWTLLELSLWENLWCNEGRAWGKNYLKNLAAYRTWFLMILSPQGTFPVAQVQELMMMIVACDASNISDNCLIPISSLDWYDLC